jgi:hypothetical protein
MFQIGEQARFRDEGIPHVLLSGKGFFQRHGLFQALIHRFIDAAHPALTNLADDTVSIIDELTLLVHRFLLITPRSC